MSKSIPERVNDQCADAGPCPHSQWRPMLSPIDHVGPAWCAVRVYTGGKFLRWDIHYVEIDDETNQIAPDFHQGWEVEDYDFWMPATPPMPPHDGGEAWSRRSAGGEEAEPVAWMTRYRSPFAVSDWKMSYGPNKPDLPDPFDGERGHEVEPLFAAPPMGGWKPDREAVARAIDPDAWASDGPVPTRADVLEFHARRQASVIAADRVIAAIPSTPEGGAE